MFIKQLSVFVENKAGRLADITRILADNAINILALSIADTTDFGILRLIVEDPEKALTVLKENNLMVKTTDVIAISITHTPGSLSTVLKKLDDAGVAIEYMYDFSNRSKGQDPMIILRLNNQDKALEALKASGVTILSSDVVKNL
ncbi:MAG: ACT domain-containing protein [Clostridiales bacterium]|nr:ACT domain-containing protein [Clostridiales bacterium]